MPAAVQARMESSFSADFSEVRIHQGDEAAALGARAFARGNDLHFAPGAYDPHSATGQQLLGHELAHVVQQRAGVVQGAQGKGLAVNADPALEAEADRAGEQAARGERATVAGAERAGGTASGDTLQGMFPLFPMLRSMFAPVFELVELIADDVSRYYERRQRELREQQAREQKAREDAEKVLEARADAEQLDPAIAQAAELAKLAAAEGVDASGALDAAAAASHAIDGVRDATQPDDAERSLGDAQRFTLQAVAAVVQAVTAIIGRHAEAAESGSARSQGGRKLAEQADDAAARAARDAAEAAEAARAHAAKVIERASKDRPGAVSALKDAIACVHQAIECAGTASNEARDSRQAALDADHGARQTAKSTSALDDSAAVNSLEHRGEALGAQQPRSVDQVRELIERARRDAHQHQHGATQDAREAQGRAEHAADADKTAASEARMGEAAVFSAVGDVIQRQNDRLRSARSNMEQIVKAAKIAEITDAARVVEDQLNAVTPLRDQLAAAERDHALDKLPALLDQALAAAKIATDALAGAKAAQVRHEARGAVDCAKALAESLSAKAERVAAHQAAAQDAMRMALAALDDAQRAMDAASKAQAVASNLASQVTADDDGLKIAAQITRLFGEAHALIEQARASYERAESKACEAEQQAKEAQRGAAPSQELAEVQAHGRKAASAQSNVGKLDQEVASAKHSEKLASVAQDTVSRQARDAAATERDASGARKTAASGQQRARELDQHGPKAIATKIAELADQAAAALKQATRPGEWVHEQLFFAGFKIEGLTKTLADIDCKLDTTPGPSDGAAALQQALAARGDAEQQLAAAEKAARAAEPRVAGLRALTDLEQATAEAREIRELAGGVEDGFAPALEAGEQLRGFIEQADAYVRSHRPVQHQGARPDLSTFSKADEPTPITDRMKQRYTQAWSGLTHSGQVLDPGNLANKQAVPTEVGKYYSTVMELEYLRNAVRIQGTYAQVGRMRFAELKRALDDVGLTAQAQVFDDNQASIDAKLFNLEIKDLAYEADGVLWRANSVEVVQHKRTINYAPLEPDKRNNKTTSPFEDQLRAASNQLGGWTADGGVSARGGQPEYPPPGLNRTRLVSVELANTDQPVSLNAYLEVIRAAMIELALDHRTPRYVFVDEIRIRWRNGVTLLSHGGNGTYTV